MGYSLQRIYQAKNNNQEGTWIMILNKLKRRGARTWCKETCKSKTTSKMQQHLQNLNSTNAQSNKNDNWLSTLSVLGLTFQLLCIHAWNFISLTFNLICLCWGVKAIALSVLLHALPFSCWPSSWFIIIVVCPWRTVYLFATCCFTWCTVILTSW